jgi:hypothetical protein
MKITRPNLVRSNTINNTKFGWNSDTFFYPILIRIPTDFLDGCHLISTRLFGCKSYKNRIKIVRSNLKLSYAINRTQFGWNLLSENYPNSIRFFGWKSYKNRIRVVCPNLKPSYAINRTQFGCPISIRFSSELYPIIRRKIG